MSIKFTSVSYTSFTLLNPNSKLSPVKIVFKWILYLATWYQTCRILITFNCLNVFTIQFDSIYSIVPKYILGSYLLYSIQYTQLITKHNHPKFVHASFSIRWQMTIHHLYSNGLLKWSDLYKYKLAIVFHQGLHINNYPKIYLHLNHLQLDHGHVTRRIHPFRCSPTWVLPDINGFLFQTVRNYNYLPPTIRESSSLNYLNWKSKFTHFCLSITIS